MQFLFIWDVYTLDFIFIQKFYNFFYTLPYESYFERLLEFDLKFYKPKVKNNIFKCN